MKDLFEHAIQRFPGAESVWKANTYLPIKRYATATQEQLKDSRMHTRKWKFK
jgi:hypothetical protein